MTLTLTYTTATQTLQTSPYTAVSPEPHFRTRRSQEGSPHVPRLDAQTAGRAHGMAPPFSSNSGAAEPTLNHCTLSVTGDGCYSSASETGATTRNKRQPICLWLTVEFCRLVWNSSGWSSTRAPRRSPVDLAEDNVLRANDGDHVSQHVALGHEIEALWIGTLSDQPRDLVGDRPPRIAGNGGAQEPFRCQSGPSTWKDAIVFMRERRRTALLIGVVDVTFEQ